MQQAKSSISTTHITAKEKTRERWNELDRQKKNQGREKRARTSETGANNAPQMQAWSRRHCWVAAHGGNQTGFKLTERFSVCMCVKRSCRGRNNECRHNKEWAKVYSTREWLHTTSLRKTTTCPLLSVGLFEGHFAVWQLRKMFLCLKRIPSAMAQKMALSNTIVLWYAQH